MARFLIGTMSITGHVNPALPIARRLVERGHEVGWYTGKRFQDRIEETGARYLATQCAPDIDDRDFDAVAPERAKREGIARLKFDLKHVFADPIPNQVEDLRAILADFPADVLLADTGFAGSGLLHELGGPPWATFGITVLMVSGRDTAPFGLGQLPNSAPLGRMRNRTLNWMVDHIIFRDVNAYFQKIRKDLGLPPSRKGLFDRNTSPYLNLIGTVPAFEYPRSDLDPTVHFIGALLPEAVPEFTPPVWWREMQAAKSVVLVTQGTLATDFRDLMVPALNALAEEDVFVVAMTAGKPLEIAENGQTPKNAHIAAFLPNKALMPQVDVLVTNGGYGTIQFALAAGVPVVASGTTEDKAEVGNRVEWSGVGINLRAQRPTPEAIRAAVRKILDSSQFMLRARQIKTEFAKHHAPAEAAMLLEQLAATGQPVLRKEK